jgi:hypothetical protein
VKSLQASPGLLTRQLLRSSRQEFLAKMQVSTLVVGRRTSAAGTLAALGRPGDTYRFYEINPEVVRFSMGPHAYFTFNNDSAADVQVVMGDARMALAQEAARGELQRFDVLVLDAFSSDAIPVHLLTREAFQIYRQHLNGPSSVIAIHISNSVLDLGPDSSLVHQTNQGQQNHIRNRTSPRRRFSVQLCSQNFLGSFFARASSCCWSTSARKFRAVCTAVLMSVGSGGLWLTICPSRTAAPRKISSS